MIDNAPAVNMHKKTHGQLGTAISVDFADERRTEAPLPSAARRLQTANPLRNEGWARGRVRVSFCAPFFFSGPLLLYPVCGVHSCMHFFDVYNLCTWNVNVYPGLVCMRELLPM